MEVFLMPVVYYPYISATTIVLHRQPANINKTKKKIKPSRMAIGCFYFKVIT